MARRTVEQKAEQYLTHVMQCKFVKNLAKCKVYEAPQGGWFYYVGTRGSIRQGKTRESSYPVSYNFRQKAGIY